MASSKKALDHLQRSTNSNEGNFVKVSRGNSLEFKKILRGEFITILKMRRVVVERFKARTT